MDLNEMKAALEGEAQRKVKELERYNKKLASEIRIKQDMIKRREESLRVMYNRCYSTNGFHTSGTMCLFCGEINNCNMLRSVGKGERENGTKEKQE